MLVDIMTAYRLDRRRFLGTSTSLASASILVDYFGFSEAEAKGLNDDVNSEMVQTLKPGDWSDKAGHAKRRYDGLAKVTGSKVYGRDFHSADLKGWPKQELRVVILRANASDKILKGIDSEKLKSELKISKIVTHLDFDRDKLRIPFYFGRLMMTKFGQAPDYLGQPVALLYFTKEDFLDAGARLFDLSEFLIYGEAAPPHAVSSYGETRLTRYSEKIGQDSFSVVQDGLNSAPWEKAAKTGSSNARCVYYGEKIVEEIKSSGWQVFEEHYTTQMIDPLFMESESGLGWFEKNLGGLHLTLGTQSPYDDAAAAGEMFSDPKSAFHIKSVKLNCCYPGGGFGGRDHSDFPLYLALAAIYADGEAVRISFSRFDQFQAGIKRHASAMTEVLAVDKAGQFQALRTNIALNGGGQNNFSFAVQAVAAQNATSAYYFPKLDIESKALSSVAVTAGSMRGFGTVQSMFALESLIDQAAEHLHEDAIRLRRKNLLTKAKRTATGATPTYEIQSDRILEAAQASPLWTNRAAVKKQRDSSESVYGVGFALALKSYGTNLDACLAEVSVSEDGKFAIKCNAVDMGNGAATTLSLVISDLLGQNADSIKLGVAEDFSPLQLVASFENDQNGETEKAKNPRWVPFVSMANAASCSAFQMRHAVREAASVLLRYGLWPAACHITGIEDRAFDLKRLRWDDGVLIVDGTHKVPLKKLTKHVFSKSLVSGAMVHTYYRAQWAKADFRIGDQPDTMPIDALAIKLGKHKDFSVLDRENVAMPPFKNKLIGVDMYAPYGLLVGLTVNRKTGQVTVEEAEGYLDCGPVIQYEMVDGQAAGAFAMGMGQALYEDLPPTTGGPGEGGWNIGRYRVATMRDVPFSRFKLKVISPVPGDPPKGIAEVVLCAVPPAIANAIAHATGKRFRELPITPDKILKALS